MRPIASAASQILARSAGSRFGAVRIGISGVYTLPALASGAYWLAAVSDEEMTIWPTRPMLSALAGRAERLQLNSSGSIVKDLTMPARESR